MALWSGTARHHWAPLVRGESDRHQHLRGDASSQKPTSSNQRLAAISPAPIMSADVSVCRCRPVGDRATFAAEPASANLQCVVEGPMRPGAMGI